jgi:hypothetical protein
MITARITPGFFNIRSIDPEFSDKTMLLQNVLMYRYHFILNFFQNVQSFIDMLLKIDLGGINPLDDPLLVNDIRYPAGENSQSFSNTI